MSAQWLKIACAILLGVASASAETLQKHPRVAELEDSLRERASSYLKGRFPERPFLVTVSIDPLRRDGYQRARGEKERLPYYDGVDEEIQDEWDDPQISLHQLIARVNKAIVHIDLPDNIQDAEAQEIKDSLFKGLHLVPARDEIQIAQKAWSTHPLSMAAPLAGLLVALILLGGLYLIQKSAVSKIAKALHQPASQATAGAPFSASPGGQDAQEARRGETQVSGGLHVSDPLRARDLLLKLVENVQRSPSFPTLKAMRALEAYGERDFRRLGGLLMELPVDLQRRLFSLSVSPCWLKALDQPGIIGPEQIEFFQSIVRENDLERAPAVENLAICLWRLGDLLPQFIRNYEKNEALSYLALLPKGIAISAARQAFPGAWADLLDPSFKAAEIEPQKAQQVTQAAMKLRPLQNFEALKQHRSEAELRDYLLVANPAEEKEVYLASKSSESLKRIRPPFFPILEASEAQLTRIVPRFSPDQWALALFNLAKTERKRVQGPMSEKQVFLLIEALRRLDSNSPDPRAVGQIREQIALTYHRLEPVQETQEETVTENDDHAKAA